jgi:hypothetical protein
MRPALPGFEPRRRTQTELGISGCGSRFEPIPARISQIVGGCRSPQPHQPERAASSTEAAFLLSDARSIAASSPASSTLFLSPSGVTRITASPRTSGSARASASSATFLRYISDAFGWMKTGGGAVSSAWRPSSACRASSAGCKAVEKAPRFTASTIAWISRSTRSSSRRLSSTFDRLSALTRLISRSSGYPVGYLRRLERSSRMRSASAPTRISGLNGFTQRRRNSRPGPLGFPVLAPELPTDRGSGRPATRS